MDLEGSQSHRKPDYFRLSLYSIKSLIPCLSFSCRIELLHSPNQGTQVKVGSDHLIQEVFLEHLGELTTMLVYELRGFEG